MAELETQDQKRYFIWERFNVGGENAMHFGRCEMAVHGNEFRCGCGIYCSKNSKLPMDGTGGQTLDDQEGDDLVL